MIETIAVFIAAAFVGYMFGTYRQDRFMFDLCERQQARGDYWFDKYQRQIDSDWECLSDDAREELE